MRLTEDNPDRFLLRRLYELAYAPHPYGRVILGTPELITGLTRERLRTYYKKYYVPRQMVLVVVGAVTPAEARRQADQTFGRLTGGDTPRPAIPAPRRPRPSGPTSAGPSNRRTWDWPGGRRPPTTATCTRSTS